MWKLTWDFILRGTSNATFYFGIYVFNRKCFIWFLSIIFNTSRTFQYLYRHWKISSQDRITLYTKNIFLFALSVKLLPHLLIFQHYSIGKNISHQLSFFWILISWYSMDRLKFSRRHFSMINSSPQQYRTFSNRRELTGKLERPSTELELKPSSWYEFWLSKWHQFAILVEVPSYFLRPFTPLILHVAYLWVNFTELKTLHIEIISN